MSTLVLVATPSFCSRYSFVLLLAQVWNMWFACRGESKYSNKI